jgi:response regulator RpfG family c-di-GMP phosphodiesterase
LDNTRIVRALVVDADPHSGPAHRKRLEEEGYRVVLATDPAAASLLARKSPPSIIFINPGGQPNAASTLIEALKADTYTRHIPVRLLTASYDQGPGKKALTTVARNAW